jgi:segregation and condensation protein A
MRFRVELESYWGPMDLLVYLVRQHELDVTGLPLSTITDQFLEHLTVLEQIDVNVVGEFLEMASTLMEIKSRLVLPGEEEVVEELDDPRQDLVRRLLEYKQYRDAASMLEERSRQWSDRYSRLATDLPQRPNSPAELPIGQIELWDLVSAFGRVLKEKKSLRGPESIRYDETPIHVYMRRIDERVRRDGRVAFTTFFDSVMHKSALVGMFLAVLELVRHQHLRAAQVALFGEIWLEPGDVMLPAELTVVAEYEHGNGSATSTRAADSK